MNSHDEAEKRIREAARDGRVEFCSREGVESFDQAFVDSFLLDILGVENAWISDRSDLSDFGPRDDVYGKIERKYGVDVRGTDNLLEIFRIIHAACRVVQ